MRKIRVGDTVERIKGCWGDMTVGHIGQVINITKTGVDKYSFAILGFSDGHDPSSFKIVNSVVNERQIDNYEMY